MHYKLKTKVQVPFFNATVLPQLLSSKLYGMKPVTKQQQALVGNKSHVMQFDIRIAAKPHCFRCNSKMSPVPACCDLVHF